jgi:hypothetical protein
MIHTIFYHNMLFDDLSCGIINALSLLAVAVQIIKMNIIVQTNFKHQITTISNDHNTHT